MYRTVFLCLFFQCIIESYHFKFKYTEKGPQMDIQRFGREFCVLDGASVFILLIYYRNNEVEMHVPLENTKRASMLLIRKLFLLMQNLDILPNKVYLTMKLYYYDDSECVGPEKSSKSLCQR